MKARLPIASDRMSRVGPEMRISRTYQFQAAHRLPNTPPDHKCHRLHGHTYEVEIEVRGLLDPELRWVCDFGRLDAAWDSLGAVLDHRYLNELDGLQHPTSETIACWLWERFATHFGGAVELSRITVRENGRSSATLTQAPVEPRP